MTAKVNGTRKRGRPKGSVSKTPKPDKTIQHKISSDSIVPKDNYELYNLEKNTNVRLTRGQAIKAFCRLCNQEKVWTASNDCVSKVCPLYPYRPGRRNV